MSKLYFMPIALILSGCVTSPRYNVSVDSLASKFAGHRRVYILLPGNKGVTWNDLQFQEYASYVIRALNHQGFLWTNKKQDADIAITLSYGIGNPQTYQSTYTLPVWGQTGISSSQTYGNVTSYGNMATYSGNTTYVPSYGVTGYRTYSRSVISYLRYAMITAYDYKEYRETKKQIKLWSTSITSSGSSGDLRRVFPVLISAGVPYFAKNTGKKIQVNLNESDEIVKIVKGVPIR